LFVSIDEQSRTKRQLILLAITLLVILAALQIVLAHLNSAAPQPAPASLPEISRTSDRSLYESAARTHLESSLSTLLCQSSGDGKEFGYDTLDPLLWPATQYLLSGPSQQKALGLLDEFSFDPRGKSDHRPFEARGFATRSLGRFDWLSQGSSHQQERAEFQTRLVRVIQRLALTPEQIKLLLIITTRQ